MRSARQLIGCLCKPLAGLMENAEVIMSAATLTSSRLGLRD